MIKTRFAPSPTGYLHVGGLRTALYSYLFARKNKGKFILRIEDTDQERYVEGALENLMKTLHWAGLEYDEGPMPDGSEKGGHGPYIQSKRSEIYREQVQKLLDSGHAYRCFCSKERLDEMRERQKSNKEATMYDRKCLDLPESEIQKNLEAGIPFVIRQKVPYELIKFKDLIRGNVQFHGKTIDDQILVKSDGFPTYHLANVVDDHLMEITHVIRGEEWLPSTPKHIALYLAFGWQAPEFAHLPLLLNEDRSKLSKRQGHVAVEEYIKAGYTKEAVLNFVAFLGWNPGAGEEKEIYTLTELVEAFSLEKVHKAGAIFNLEKLDWFNWRWQKEEFINWLHKLAKEIDPNLEITEPRKGIYEYNFSSDQKEADFLKKRGEKLLE
ncbi:glutamate--tRNA ligase, partial [Candidatus Peregrinibacteria bacterium]|nr:glutamate--tRNA ligase [Candidatus Peregrinibacteria bacterium]